MPDQTFNWKKTAIIIGVVTALTGSVTGAAKGIIEIDNRYIIKEEANVILDKRYLQLSSFEAIEKKKEIKLLDNKIFKLEFKVNSGKATPLEKALLSRYKSQLQALRNSQ